MWWWGDIDRLRAPGLYTIIPLGCPLLPGCTPTRARRALLTAHFPDWSAGHHCPPPRHTMCTDTTDHFPPSKPNSTRQRLFTEIGQGIDYSKAWGKLLSASTTRNSDVYIYAWLLFRWLIQYTSNILKKLRTAPICKIFKISTPFKNRM